MLQIARAAGVHQTTVSMALRDHPRISAKTKTKIQRLAERMGYRPNPLVSALMSYRRSRRRVDGKMPIAFLTAFPHRDEWRENPLFDHIFAGAAERVTKFGYKLEPFWLRQPGLTPSRLSHILVSRGINALLVAPVPPHSRELELTWDKFALATIGVTLTKPELHHVASNHWHGTRTAFEICQQRGYQRIGFASFSDGYFNVQQKRVGALLSAQTTLPVRQRIPPCLGSDFDPTGLRRWFQKWRPDAIVTLDVEFVRETLEGDGVRSPDDYGLVHLGCATVQPGQWHSGIFEDPKLIGATAADILMGVHMRNERGVPTNPQEVLVRGKWVEGRSLPPR